MKDYQVIVFISGILFSQILAKILKKIIKQSRPIKSKTYGMPSSRSTIVSFIVFYLILTNKLSNKSKFIIILIGLISLLMKYYLKEHSLSQLIFGIILGSIIAYIFYFIIIEYNVLGFVSYTPWFKRNVLAFKHVIQCGAVNTTTYKNIMGF